MMDLLILIITLCIFLLRDHRERRCPACGKNIRLRARYCEHCGYEIPSRYELEPEYTPVKEVDESTHKIVLGLAALAVFILCVITALKIYGIDVFPDPLAH